MHRWLAGGISTALLLGAPVSAQTFGSYGSQDRLQSAAGQVAADGSVVRGSGFKVRHLGPGTYRITFRSGYFPSGCAAISAQGTTQVIWSFASQRICPHQPSVFYVTTYDAPNRQGDEDFSFIAVEERN